MRITKIVLSNFGPHEHLEFDMDHPIVGILGDSGSGKSYVLRGIKYALTGAIEGAVSDNIRGMSFEGVLPEKRKARTEVHFRIHGRSGKIIRSFTPSSASRELFWDDPEKPVTAAAEVERQLLQILGVDAKAICDVCFPKQGELHSLLMGSEPEREALYTRLLGLGHFPKVSQILSSKVQGLVAGISDTGSRQDQLRQLLDENQTELLEIERKIETLPDRSILGVALQEWLAAKKDLDNATRATQAAVAAEGAITIPGEAEPVDHSAEISRLSDERVSKHQSCSLLEADLRHYRVLSDVTAAKMELELGLKKEAELAGAKERLSQYTSVLANNAEVTSNFEALLRLKGESDAAAAQLRVLDEEIPTMQGKLDNLKKDIQSVSELKNRAELKIQTWSLDLSQSCPVCEGPITPPTPEKKREIQQMLETHTRTLQALHTDHQSTESKLWMSVRNADMLRNDIGNKSSQISALEAKIEGQTPLAKEVLENIKMLANEERNRSLEHDRISTQVVTLKSKVATLSAGLVGSYSPPLDEEHTKEHLEIIRSEIEKTAERIRRLTQESEASKQQWDRLSRARAATQACRDIEATRLSVEMSKRAAVGNLCGLQTPDNPEETMSQIRSEQEQARELSAQLTSMTALRDRLEANLQALKDEDSRNASRRSLADRLASLSAAFGRTGIPQKYMRWRFDALADIVSDFLSAQDANYRIKVDPSESAALLFCRPDSSDPEVFFPMGRLSGGQRVRLSVAMLLALQRVVMPELGFMTLDEPSMHLGKHVETLTDLFDSLRPMLQASDAQLIIVDHDDRLRRSFSTSHTLKS